MLPYELLHVEARLIIFIFKNKKKNLCCDNLQQKAAVASFPDMHRGHTYVLGTHTTAGT